MKVRQGFLGKNRKSITRTFFAGFILLALFVVLGICLVYFSDKSNTNKVTSLNSSVTNSYEPLKPPPSPAANALEGVAVEYVTSPVKPGENSSITVDTNANSSCNITVSFNGTKLNDSGLSPKSSDVYGRVTWTWTVPLSTPVGHWPISITCLYNGKSGVVTSELDVGN